MVVRGSTLYVVERNVGSIEAIDLASLTDGGPVGSGLAMPGWLAFAGGQALDGGQRCAKRDRS